MLLTEIEGKVCKRVGHIGLVPKPIERLLVSMISFSCSRLSAFCCLLSPLPKLEEPRGSVGKCLNQRRKRKTNGRQKHTKVNRSLLQNAAESSIILGNKGFCSLFAPFSSQWQNDAFLKTTEKARKAYR